MQDADNDNSETPTAEGTEPPCKILSPAARRALVEAEERRKKQKPLELPPEIGGRGGASRRASAITKSMAERSISKSIFLLVSWP